MIAALALTMLSAAEGSHVVWANAYDTKETDVAVPAAGRYTVWAWAEGEKTNTIALGDARLRAKKASGAEAGQFVWKKAGELELEAGPAKAELDDSVAAIALSTAADFDPGKAMAVTRVFAQPRAVEDARTSIERDTDTRFSMTKFASLGEWEAFAAGLRRRILVATGLFPLPERTPLNPRVELVAEHDDYIVERAAIEVRPGFYATGNIYRPKGDGPFPGIACPHGHWKEGRFANEENGSVAARCITFARMGMASFAYDMLGYNDSKQFDHAFGEFSAEEQRALDLWGVHPFSLQLWTSIRVLDFLERLPYVDPERLACTGASGGGTQTFALTAVDPRIKVTAPVCMISHSMQGGCLCENAPLIRFNASNMEIGALAAPRPLVMVSATGDWTKQTPEVEYPAIRGIYELYGASDKVVNRHFDAPHNYNKKSREAVYRFFGKWVLGEGEKYAGFAEPDWHMEDPEALQVFPDGLPADSRSDKEIVQGIIAECRRKWRTVLPRDAIALSAFRDTYGVALNDALGTSVPETVAASKPGREVRAGYAIERLILGRPGIGDAIPALLFRPDGASIAQAVLVLHGKGKTALADLASGEPGALVCALMDAGRPVLAIDAFLTGEHHSPLKRTEPLTKKYPDAFLPTTTALRVQDIVTALAYLRSQADGAEPPVVGLGEAGMWALFAAAVDGHAGAVVVDADGFANTGDAAWVERCYVPCIRAIGGVATAAALIPPRRLTIFNTGGQFDAQPMKDVYAAMGTDPLTVWEGDLPAADIVAIIASAP